MRIEEEGYARSELIDFESAVNGRLHVSDRIRESKGHFLRCGGTRFANVITGDRYGVPARGVAGAISKDIRHYSEALSRRINISAARYILLQDIILHCAGDSIRLDA